MPGGALDLEGVDRFGDGTLAGAQFLDTTYGERDDWMVGVLVFLKSKRLTVQRAVYVAWLA